MKHQIQTSKKPPPTVLSSPCAGVHRDPLLKSFLGRRGQQPPARGRHGQKRVPAAALVTNAKRIARGCVGSGPLSVSTRLFRHFPCSSTAGVIERTHGRQKLTPPPLWSSFSPVLGKSWADTTLEQSRRPRTDTRVEAEPEKARGGHYRRSNFGNRCLQDLTRATGGMGWQSVRVGIKLLPRMTGLGLLQLQRNALHDPKPSAFGTRRIGACLSFGDGCKVWTSEGTPAAMCHALWGNDKAQATQGGSAGPPQMQYNQPKINAP